VEACPVDAIHMDANEVEIARTSRKDMIWNMQELLGDQPKTPR
jgi:formate hydrogenlyase subunit 6/NADH:ubiquinone oxidoreductase subunit I